jgi:hypothetical protein
MAQPVEEKENESLDETSNEHLNMRKYKSLYPTVHGKRKFRNALGSRVVGVGMRWIRCSRPKNATPFQRIFSRRRIKQVGTLL